MIIWTLIVIALDLILIISYYQGYHEDFILGVAYLILLTAVGILYRIFKEMRMARIEKLEKLVSQLQEENEQLKLVSDIQKRNIPPEQDNRGIK
ncbi:hypothetical protein JW877_08630 [bacterium]|nr:hypothetical protein [bacterium]